MLATHDLYQVENGIMIQACSYVSSCDSWFESIFKVRPAQVTIGDYEGNAYHGIDVYILIMGAEDLKKVNLGVDPTEKFCDEMSLSNGFCKELSPKEKARRKPLNDVIDSHDFSLPIQSSVYNTANDSPFSYNIGKSDFYCAIIHSKDIPAGHDLLLQVDWKHSFGELSAINLHLSFCFMILYEIYGLIYIYLLYIDNSVILDVILSVHQFRSSRFMFQFRILSIIGGIAMAKFLSVITSIIRNVFPHSRIILWGFGRIEMILELLVTVWVLYNFILFSVGGWILAPVKYARVENIALYNIGILLLEILLHDLISDSKFSLVRGNAHDKFSSLIMFHFIATVLLFFGWAGNTILAIEEKRTRNLYGKTVVVLGAVFIIDFLLKKFMGPFGPAFFPSFASFCGVIAISILWRNVTFVSNRLVV